MINNNLKKIVPNDCESFNISFDATLGNAGIEITNWLEENKDLPAGTEVSREVGKCKFRVDGVEIDAVAQPFRFYLMKRLDLVLWLGLSLFPWVWQ